MSLETAIRDLIEVVQVLTRLLELQQGIEAGELKMHSADREAVEAGEDVAWFDSPVQEPQEPPPSETIEGMNEKTLALIALSDELGYKYLLHEGALAVDNRVLDEFNRRSLPDTLEP